MINSKFKGKIRKPLGSVRRSVWLLPFKACPYTTRLPKLVVTPGPPLLSIVRLFVSFHKCVGFKSKASIPKDVSEMRYPPDPQCPISRNAAGPSSSPQDSHQWYSNDFRSEIVFMRPLAGFTLVRANATPQARRWYAAGMEQLNSPLPSSPSLGVDE